MRAKFPALVILGALLVACSDAPVPTAPADLTGDALFTVLEGEGAVCVLNVQLRPVPSGDASPPSMAWGHLQVKLRGATPPDDSYPVAWRGMIFNPDQETVIAGGIFLAGATPPDDGQPPPEDGKVLGIGIGVAGSTPPDDSIVGFSGEGSLNETQAADLFSPDALAWFTTDEGALAGRFQPPEPIQPPEPCMDGP